MGFDILIFAAIAAVLVYRLYSILGTRGPDDRQRPNPFSAPDAPAARETAKVIDIDHARRDVPALPLADVGQLVDEKSNADGRVEAGLAEIAAADARFDPHAFIQGARAAFEIIVTAYNKGERETLRPLLSPKLFNDFDAGIATREKQGHTSEVTIRAIKAARVVEAHLGGTMAYITVDFDVEESIVTRDAEGNIVDGSPDRVFSVEDIWTFTRDIRASDPNWTLIETRSVED